MSKNVEQLFGNETNVERLMKECWMNPNTFFPIADLQSKFSWTDNTMKSALQSARHHLKDEAIYSINSEGGIVFERTRLPVGDRIYPLFYRPDPAWVSEFPDRLDVEKLFETVRFAVVTTDSEAVSFFSPTEHKLLIRVMANYTQGTVDSPRGIGQYLHVSDTSACNLVTGISNKLVDETHGEWVIAKLQRGGVHFALEHRMLCNSAGPHLRIVR